MRKPPHARSDREAAAGTASAYAPDKFRSFVWNSDTKATDWRTSYDEGDLDKSGAFARITNSGIIAGSMKDKNLTVEIPGDDWSPGYTITLTTASVWKDGKTYKLGTGDNDKSLFTDETDGSYVSGMSEDGSIVTGYLQWSYFPQTAYRWEYDMASDSYK